MRDPIPEFPSLWAYICYDGDDTKLDSDSSGSSSPRNFGPTQGNWAFPTCAGPVVCPESQLATVLAWSQGMDRTTHSDLMRLARTAWLWLCGSWRSTREQGRIELSLCSPIRLLRALSSCCPGSVQICLPGRDSDDRSDPAWLQAYRESEPRNCTEPMSATASTSASFLLR